MKKLSLVIVIILVSVISAASAENNTPEFLYQKGLYLETAKADYEGAIKVQDINFLSKELKKKVSVNFDNAPLRAVLIYLQELIIRLQSI